MLKNSLFQPSLSFSDIVLFLFLFLPFSVSALPLCFFFFLPFFSFQFTCALFFSPKTFFSAQNNSLFSPKTFFSAQTFLPKRFSVFQPKRFSAQTFLLQPKTFFSSAHTTVSASFCFVLDVFLFVGSVFSTPFLFVQRLFSSFFFSASFSFSCQLRRPKIFSLDASHFFYLNKSLFSSNLE